MIMDTAHKSFNPSRSQTSLNRPKSRVLPIILHAIALASLTITLAIMLLLSISNVKGGRGLGLALVEFNSVTLINVVDGKTGQIVVQNPSSVSVSFNHSYHE